MFGACSFARGLLFSLGAFHLSKNDWLGVGEYDESSATMVSQLLTLMKMPHRVVPELNENYATPRIMPFSIWVAPENLEEAKRILAEGQVSEWGLRVASFAGTATG